MLLRRHHAFSFLAPKTSYNCCTSPSLELKTQIPLSREVSRVDRFLLVDHCPRHSCGGTDSTPSALTLPLPTLPPALALSPSATLRLCSTCRQLPCDLSATPSQGMKLLRLMLLGGSAHSLHSSRATPSSSVAPLSSMIAESNLHQDSVLTGRRAIDELCRLCRYDQSPLLDTRRFQLFLIDIVRRKMDIDSEFQDNIAVR